MSNRKGFNRGFARRAFLSGLGASAVLAPFLPTTNVEAGQDMPKRLVLLNGTNGTVYGDWLPTGSETNFSLGPILSPLAPFQDRLLVLGGMRVGRQGPGQGHSLGNGAMWTGSQLLDDPLFTGMGGPSGWSGGTSVDQVVAEQLGAATPYKTLEFGVQCGGASNGTRTIYAGANQPLAPEDDPYTMFARLFGDVGQDDTSLERIRAERRSVIDLVKADLAGMQVRLGKAEQYKLDAHLEGIRDIEKLLEFGGPGGAACDVQTVGGGLDVFANDNFPALSRVQLDMLVTALTCGLSNVVSMQWSRGLSPTRFTWLGSTEEHHELSHSGDGDTAAQRQLTDINTWYAGEVAYLLGKLDAIPEGNGSMLDNTLVVWGNALAKGSTHSSFPVPFVLAGGAGGYFNTGRFIDYGDELQNRLLVSICDALGLDEVDTYGDMDDGSGPLPGLT